MVTKNADASLLTPVVVSVLFFAAYLFLVDRAWVYIIEAFTWVINKIAGA